MPLSPSKAAASAALISLAALATVAVFNGSHVAYVLESGTAGIRAVGDAGCLGRSCPLSDKSAEKDLETFFDHFHSGGKTAHVLELEQHDGATTKLAKLDSKHAAADLDTYYDSLPHSKTDKVVGAEGQGEYVVKLADNESRKDLNSYYDHLKSGPGKNEKIVHNEEAAKQEALRLHLQGVIQLKKEEERMLKREAASVIQAKQDKEHFSESEEAESNMQYAGHSMEAVRSTRQSAREARKAAGSYFDSLQQAVKKTPQVLEAEEKGVAQAKAYMHRVAEEVGVGAGRLVPPAARRLSKKQDQALQADYFSSLQQQVRKSPRVLAAEEHAQAQAAKYLEHAHAVALALTAPVRPAVGDARVSATEARKELDEAVDALPVHKTASVLRAVARARAAMRAWRQFEASLGPGAETKKASLAVPAESGAPLTAEQAWHQLEADVSNTPTHKTAVVLHAEARSKAREAQLHKRKATTQIINGRMPPTVAAAVPSTRLSAAEARKELDASVDTIPAHFQQALPKVKPAVGDARLSAAAARDQQARYFASLPAVKRVVPHVAGAVGDEQLSAQEARVQLDKAVDSLPARKQALPVVQSAVGDVQLSGPEARSQLDADVDALPAYQTQLPVVRPAVGDTPLSGGQARRRLDAAIDALPAEKRPLPHVAGAVGDRRLSSSAARTDQATYFASLPAVKRAPPKVAGAVGDERLSGKQARSDLEQAIDRFPAHKATLPHIKAAVSDTPLSGVQARKWLDAAIDALPSVHQSLPHVAGAVGDRRLSGGEARKEQGEYFASLPAQKRARAHHTPPAVSSQPLSGVQARKDLDEAVGTAPTRLRPLTRGAAAVPNVKLTGDSARKDMDGFFDALKAPKAKPAVVAPAVGDTRLGARQARYQLTHDLEHLKHS